MHKVILFLMLFAPAFAFSQDDTIPAKYKGGEQAMYKFIQENLKYPAFARDEGVDGRVFAAFEISASGEMENLRIVKPVGCGLDEETLRVIQLMKNQWEPGSVNGKPFRCRMTLPVAFQLRGGKPISEKKRKKAVEKYEELKKKGEL